MKEYLNPEVQIIKTTNLDIIITSPGTETGIVDEGDGVWDLDLG